MVFLQLDETHKDTFGLISKPIGEEKMSSKRLQYQSAKAKLKAGRFLDKTLHAGNSKRVKNGGLRPNKRDLVYPETMDFTALKVKPDKAIDKPDVPAPLKMFLDEAKLSKSSSLVDCVLKCQGPSKESLTDTEMFFTSLERFLSAFQGAQFSQNYDKAKLGRIVTTLTYLREMQCRQIKLWEQMHALERSMNRMDDLQREDALQKAVSLHSTIQSLSKLQTDHVKRVFQIHAS